MNKELVENLMSLTVERQAEFFRSLSVREQEELDEILTRCEVDQCAGSLERFAASVVTRDEHAEGSESVRSFPTRSEKPYLWTFLDSCRRERLLLVEKSRQMMLTWAVCLYALWVAKYQKNRLIFIQSKKEEDACNLVFNKDPVSARISFMERNLPPSLRSLDFDRDASYGRLFFPETGSVIRAVPEGGDQIRSYTPSIVISDEFAYQDEAEAAWRAIKPTACQFIGISSARAGAYMRELMRR